VWFDSPYGYRVNQDNATVFWNLTGFGDDAKNIRAWIVLYNMTDPNKELRSILINPFNSTTKNTNLTGVLCTGALDLSTFIRTHDQLFARLIIVGLDWTTGQWLYESGPLGVDGETFVYDEGAKPVKVNLVDKTQLQNIKTGENRAIVFTVNQRVSPLAPVSAGLLKITFEGKYDFYVDVIDGIEQYIKKYNINNISDIVGTVSMN